MDTQDTNNYHVPRFVIEREEYLEDDDNLQGDEKYTDVEMYERDDEQFRTGEYQFDDQLSKIITMRKAKKTNTFKLSVAKTPVLPSPSEDKVEETVLSIPKEGWLVKKVEISETVDFSNSDLFEKKKINWKNVPKSKWKTATSDFFSEPDFSAPPPVPTPEVPQSHVRTQDKSRRPPQKEFANAVHDTKEYRQPRLLQKQKQEHEHPPDPVDNKTVYKNTRLCNFGSNCKRKECSFAHSVEEFTPVECRFDERCRTKDTCKFKHRDETKEAFIRRSGLNTT